MILSASLRIGDQTKTCQVSAELELDNQITADMLSSRTVELLKGLQSGIMNGLSDRSVLNSVQASNQLVLPGGNVAVQTQEQHTRDSVSPRQMKYLNDLLIQCRYTLAKWCKEKHVPMNQITSAHCGLWIPELKERVKNEKLQF